ncbi:MAG: ROK family protein [Anaeromyxobacter sp.]
MASRAAVGVSPRTLCVDIGGSGIKTMVVSLQGDPLSERSRIQTPRPATARAVVSALRSVAPDPSGFERVSVGFPGVVREGVVFTAPNLDPSWAGFDLAAALRKATDRPVRVLNDAGVQGHGVIHGRGVEICITLGTGFGFALFVEGRYVPNIELGHHPFRKGKTYEDLLGNAALEKRGRKRWQRTLLKAVDQLQRTFNFDALFVGGGNAAKLTVELPANVKRVENVSGLLGGVKLWERDG